ncbi:tol-pal system protein YbgF [Gallaecimonas mangrovi]|uniref:tol-pal system protein YbgF n=1 Tax=Gallaecimonas mangrovi TaxID=2291597 RepID=UPI000E20C699|nr:tol-pal system protein YbgF [Gallaecimonas mangrovi]
MKKPLTSLLLLVGLSGAAHAASAPVVDADGNSVGGEDLATRVSRLEAQFESRSRMQLQMQQRLSSLQDDLSDLRGITEEHGHQIQQLLDRQREIYKELAALQQPSSAGDASATNTDTTATVPVGAISASDAAAAPAANNGAAATDSKGDGYSDNLSENDAYDRAVGLVLKQKDYAKATVAFRKFIKDFPKSSYIDNANYWLGQLLYSDRKLGEAAQSFSQVVNHYPNSTKRADAMLKLGIIAQEKGDKAGASGYFKRVMKEYPDSTSARLAKDRLASL